MKSSGRILYIDFLKALAIIAVLLDHFRELYDNSVVIGSATFYSVSVFVVLAGMTAYYSVDRFIKCKNSSWGGYLYRRLKSLISTYVVASTICFLMQSNNRIENITTYLDSLIFFNQPAPSYYIVVYIQLVVVAPVLYALIQKVKRMRHPSIGILFLLAASLEVAYTLTVHGPVFQYYGGAAFLLTGSYLFLFTLGMMFSAFNGEEKLLQLKYLNVLSLPILLWSGYRVANNQWIYDVFPAWIINPPNTVIMVYALSISWAVIIGLNYLRNVEWLNKFIIKPFSMIGRNSMDVFLFHMPVATIIWPHIFAWKLPLGITKMLQFFIPLLLPIAVRAAYTRLKQWILKEL